MWMYVCIQAGLFSLLQKYLVYLNFEIPVYSIISVKCCVMRLVCCYCLCVLIRSHFQRRWLAEM
jgi:hypothetical protein